MTGVQNLSRSLRYHFWPNYPVLLRRSLEASFRATESLTSETELDRQLPFQTAYYANPLRIYLPVG